MLVDRMKFQTICPAMPMKDFSQQIIMEKGISLRRIEKMNKINSKNLTQKSILKVKQWHTKGG